MINNFTLLKKENYSHGHPVQKQMVAAERHSTNIIFFDDTHDVIKNNASSFLIHTCSKSESQAAVLPTLKTSIMKTLLSKYRVFAIALTVVFLFASMIAGAATRFSVATGNWNSTGTWSASSGGASGASVPASGDVVTIEGGFTVTLNVNMAATISSITISSGSTFSVSANFTVTATTITVNGTYTNNSTGTITVTTMTVGSTGTYTHNIDGGTTIPTATWNAASTLNMTGITGTNPAGSSQAFGNVTWNCAAMTGNRNFTPTSIAGNFLVSSTNTGQLRVQTTTLTISGNYTQSGTSSVRIASGTTRTWTIGGNFSMSGGTLEMNDGGGVGTLNVAGNFSHTGGTIQNSENSANTAEIVFNGSGTQNYTSGGTFTNDINFTVNSGSTLQMGTNLLGNGSGGTFNLLSGGTLKIGDASGITTSGASGNVQVSGTRTYNAGANYTYNGTGAQNTGNGYPTALTGSLSIDNSGNTVTITAAARTITTGTLNLVNGIFATTNGSDRLSLGSTAQVNRSGGSITGTLQGTGIYNVTYTGNSKTAGPELNNGGLNNVTVSLTSGQTLTLDANRTPDGNLSITTGIFDLSTFTFNRSAGGGTLTLSNGATLKLGGTTGGVSGSNFPSSNFAATLNATSTVEYDGDGATSQTINATPSYGHLILTNGNATGTATKTTTGTITATGDVTVNTGVTCNTANSWSVTGNWAVDGTFNHTGGTFTFASGGTHTFSGAGSSQFAALTTSSQTINAGSHDIRISGNWTHGTAGVFNAQTSTVTFNGTGPQTQGTAVFIPSFYNMVINNGVTGTMSSRVWTVNNNFDLQSGTFAPSTTSSFFNLKLTGGTFTAPAAITVSNDWTYNGGTFTPGTGTVTFSSASAQTIGGVSTSTFNNIAMAGAGSKTFEANCNLTNTMTFSAGPATIDFNGGSNNKVFTLKSDATNTARIANVNGFTLSGDVTNERFIPLRSGLGRAYRFLTSTVNTSTSMRTNWMEGGQVTVAGGTSNPVPGFGTHITGSGTLSNNFDVTQTNQSSIYTAANGGTSATLVYTAVANASGTLSPTQGYFVFVRGNRSESLSLPTTPGMSTSATTLRATGTLLTGTQTSFGAMVGGAGSLNVVTNPYESPIDWSLVQPACSNVGTSYTLWDPNFGTRGGFVTVNTSGVASSGAATQHIQPGQAFFVESTGGVPAISIQEGHKSAVNNNGVFRPAILFESFRTELYFTEQPSGFRRIADAVIALYDNSYSAGLDGNDASEINNWDENIAIAREGKHLAIESRPVIITRDTLPLFMNNMRQMAYEFEFTPSLFTNAGLKAELIDNFLATRTVLSVTATTVVSFTVTSDPASSATDRFMLVFGPQVALAVDLITVRAYKNNNGVKVDWTSRTETDMDHYEVERSANGINFGMKTTVAAIGNSSGAVNYGWFDANPQMGNNFYRIKGFDQAGNFRYSQVVKVLFGKDAPGIVVYPNPIVGNSFTVDMNNMPKAMYRLSLINNLGQEVFSEAVMHGGGSVMKTITMKQTIPQGTYQLVLKGDNGMKLTQQIIKD